MSNVTVIGAQWGDEGKGKVVDWLSARADVVIRFQGGHNAGHTLMIDGTEFKLSLLPSGIVRKDKLSVIGNGVVVDPQALLAEIETIRAKGVAVTPENFLISDIAHMILPIHHHIDDSMEHSRGRAKIGTTRRGIGPAYEDKVGRRGVRICDLYDLETLQSKLEALYAYHNAFFRGLGVEEMDPAPAFEMLRAAAPDILNYAGPVWPQLDQALSEDKRLLFEGAQGIMLDVDHGTFPYVTSSNTAPGQAATGSGLGPHALGRILGIAKAYTTRVGSGPFPTEQDNEKGAFLGERGHEYGTVTGRKRRCGWFDSVMVRQSVKSAGLSGLVLTKLDVLDGLEEIPVGIGYEVDGQRLERFPAEPHLQKRLQPVYETLPGWQQSTKGARSWADLPAEAIKYIRRIEELTHTPVWMVSTSPEREDMIMVQDPFKAVV